MRRIVPVLILFGGVASCDPTGNTDFLSSSATVRVVNLISDAPTITVSAGGVDVAAAVAFGAVSTANLVKTDDDEFTTVRNSDDFVMQLDTVVMTIGRRYTFYALGTSAAKKAKFALDDTTFGAAGVFKFRFVHGAKAQEVQGLDLYISLASDSLADITPLVPSLPYGVASPYVNADTGFTRIRVTQTGLTTTLLDTTLATAFADSNNITIVVSDKSGGGGPMRLGVVVDKAP